MDKYEIVNRLARERKVEEFIRNTAKTSAPELDDLAQDVYLSLLDMEDEKITGLWERGELEFWIARIISNQYFSTSSPFYTKYKKFLSKSEPIKNTNITEEKTWMDKKRVCNQD